MYCISKDVIMTHLDDEAALLNVKTGKYYSLNSTGVRIWELLEQHNEIGQICSIIQNEYIIGIETICHDAENLVQSMVHAGLIHII